MLIDYSGSDSSCSLHQCCVRRALLSWVSSKHNIVLHVKGLPFLILPMQ